MAYRQISEQERAQVVAAFELGKSAQQAANEVGVSLKTAQRLMKAWKSQGSQGEGQGLSLTPQTVENAVNIVNQARRETVDKLKGDFAELVDLAVERAKDCLQPNAEPNSVQMQTARWAIDKLVASADAKETAKAAHASADKYAEVLERITARPPEVEERMRAIGRVQNEVVERRRPHIISPPDSESA